MKRLIPVLLLALTLGGCWNPFASFTNPLGTPTLATIEETYGVALSVAVGYRDSCAKRLIASSCRTVVPVIQAYGNKAQSAVIAARNFSRNNPTLDGTSLLLAAYTAVTDFKNAEDNLGVK